MGLQWIEWEVIDSMKLQKKDMKPTSKGSYKKSLQLDKRARAIIVERGGICKQSYKQKRQMHKEFQ